MAAWQRWIGVIGAWAMLGACGGGGGGGSSPPPVAATGTLIGIVTSASDGTLVSGATATVAALPAVTTDAQGAFQVASVAVSERVVVRVAAPGFNDTIGVAPVRAGETTVLQVSLVRIEATAVVDAAVAVNVTSPASPARASAPANSFVRADTGGAATGPLTAKITSLNPGQDPDRLPGDYTTGTGAAAAPIESFGAIGFDLRDAAGNRYDLAAGRTATIRIPVSTPDDAPPATTPLFYLDENTGAWVEQGTATLAGTGADRYYEGTVAHFSTWAAARRFDRVRVTGCVQSANGSRVRSRAARANGVAYAGSGRGVSDANGTFTVAVRRGDPAVLAVSGRTPSGSAPATRPQRVGPFNADTTLPDCLIERPDTATLPPTLVEAPAGASVAENGNARFSVIADGATPLRYQWRRNGTDIVGATGPAYTFFAALADSGAVFSVVVSNANGTLTSPGATLTVNAANAAPSIVTPPANVTVQAGQTASFSVVAAGTPPLAYQWRRNGTPIAGATAATHVTPPTTAGDTGASFDVVVTNGVSSITSAAATLTVTTAQPVAGTYKRALAGLLANTYGAGCRNAAGSAVGPIVVAANGDVSWDGGALSLSDVRASVALFNVTSGTLTQVGGSILGATGAVAFNDSRNAGVAQSSVSVTPQTGGTPISCNPGLAGGIAQPNLVGLVAGWMDGTTASLSCAVTPAGGVASTQTLVVSFAGTQVTLGPRSFNLAAARSVEAVTATDIELGTVDAVFTHTARYADGSAITDLTRWKVGPTLRLRYVTANLEVYDCRRP